MAKELIFDEDYLKLLNKPWQKFFKKFSEIDELPISEWKHVHILAHFYRRYLKQFNKPFSISIKGAPSKCTEIYMIRRISAMLGTSNLKIVKQYIDWVFDENIIPKNKKIRSLGFFTNTSLCNQFNALLAEQSKIYRHTKLPEEYKKVAELLDIPVSTYGDLAFAKKAMDTLSNNNNNNPYKKLFLELYRVGFEFDMIKDLK